MQTLIDGHGLDVAFQPIVDLASGRVVGAEALARFTDADGNALPTERCFLDAHAVDMGVELELAVIRLALRCEESRLPEGRYLALNVSPAVLEHDDLAFEIAAHHTEPPARGRDHRAPAGRGLRRAVAPRSTACATSASASPSTTSAPASPPSATSRA